MTSHKEGGKAFCDNKAYILQYKCVTERGGGGGISNLRDSLSMPP